MHEARANSGVQAAFPTWVDTGVQHGLRLMRVLATVPQLPPDWVVTRSRSTTLTGFLADPDMGRMRRRTRKKEGHK